jgi:lipocalin
MNYSSFGRLAFMLIILAFVPEVSEGKARFETIPSPLRNLNLDKFSGTWYEIVSTKDPVSNIDPCYCARSTFQKLSKSEISIVKSCRKSVPDLDTTKEGRATVADQDVPGAWMISFEKIRATSKFYVVAVDAAYAHSVVLGHGGASVAIYSRQPTMDLFVLASIRGQLVTQGYDVSALSETLQQGCWEEKELSQ